MLSLSLRPPLACISILEYLPLRLHLYIAILGPQQYHYTFIHTYNS